MSTSRYWVNVSADDDTRRIGTEGMTPGQALEAISEWRKKVENIHKPICILDRNGRVLVDEGRKS